MRFDYNNPQAPSDDQLADIEAWVNQQIAAGHDVMTELLAVDEAKARGAKALFGEKYGSEVRMVNMGGSEVSIELCGGCHVANTADISGFRILRDEASAAGIRRIIGVAGPAVAELVAQEQALSQQCAEILGGNDLTDESAVRADLQGLAQRLKITQEALPERLGHIADESQQLQAHAARPQLTGGLVARYELLQEHIKQGRKAQAAAQAQAALAALDDLAQEAQRIGDLRVVSKLLPNVPGKAMQQAGQSIKDRGEIDVGLLISDAQDKAMLVVVLSPQAIARLASRLGP